MATSKRVGSAAIAKRMGVDLTELREAAESKLDEIAQPSEEMNQLRKKLRLLKREGRPYQDALTELGGVSEVLRAQADSACAMIDGIIDFLPD
ncbi:MAG TPA: hypothetical protein VGW33_00175 [Terriglobia bacterium]|nr:hypothetical protein [Terriglobia bacterium]